MAKDKNGTATEIVQAFIEEQRKFAAGQRLEMLNRDLNGTIKLLTDILLPVFGSLEGFHLEYEIVGTNGVKLYADIYYEPLGLIFECDGFVAHVELMTRDRFSFERLRMRSFVMMGYKYIPFSRDEMDKKPEMCRRMLYEFLGKYGRLRDDPEVLKPAERELLRIGANGDIFTQRDVRQRLMVNSDTARKMIRKMLSDSWIETVGGSDKRQYAYRLGQRGRKWLMG
ncbi:hypothetical protein SAMN05216312_109282 [Cohnella sp. OV330]|uniref:MarR family transcriptional regulator n=1 Tax=Cohnella sp. OV330 TaxID=1855288 RepID=UPI0008E1ABF0|nr:MarR family transcriptional regulator [Cohnella sp. OV330]SFB48470.1 hypothetical protein SAMN05216312_109282 [Cohnella sp. OV330]